MRTVTLLEASRYSSICQKTEKKNVLNLYQGVNYVRCREANKDILLAEDVFLFFRNWNYTGEMVTKIDNQEGVSKGTAGQEAAVSLPFSVCRTCKTLRRRCNTASQAKNQTMTFIPAGGRACVDPRPKADGFRNCHLLKNSQPMTIQIPQCPLDLVQKDKLNYHIPVLMNFGKLMLRELVEQNSIRTRPWGSGRKLRMYMLNSFMST